MPARFPHLRPPAMIEPRFLEGRSALVTGGSGGLGAVMAARLAQAGANVMIADVAADGQCSATRSELSARNGVAVEYCRADLSEAEQVDRVVQTTLERFGSVEILINNAVVRHFDPIERLALEDWNQALAVNLTAPFLATQKLLPVMRKAGFGRIFNMTSVFGARGTANRVGYVATKAALLGLTSATAIEVARSPISCHSLTPGSVLTPGVKVRVDALIASEAISPEEAERRFLEGKQPNGRFVDPASVAEVMLMLCGPVGLDMNGANLPIEGGWLARA